MVTFKQFWRDLALGTKLAILTSLLVMVVVFVLTFLTVWRERTSFQQELEGQARLLLDTLPLTMRDQLYRMEVDELLDIAQVVSRNGTVIHFVVYDAAGSVLVDAAEPAPVFSQVPDPLGVQVLETGKDTLYLDWQTDQLLAGRAIMLGNQCIGAVSLGLSTTSLDQKIAALTRQSVLVAVVLLVAGGGSSFWLARQVTTPLSTLSHVAGQMAGGHLSERVNVLTEDEIGHLGDAFNRMADAIQKREHDLRDLAVGLERTVAERTSELRQQNTELMKINEALSIARQEAEAADRAKSAVLSMVSHELRTPLTSILGFAKLIKRRISQVTSSPDMDAATFEQAVARVDNNIDIIVSEGDRLIALINNVLDLAKIESGKVEWHMEPVAMEAVIEQSTAATAALFAAKPLDLVVDIASDLPCITADRNRLVQVMVNLISNAVKFTESGSVTCRARQEGDELLVSVTDTGVGIDPRDFGKVFAQFVQVGTQWADMPKGTGLGLPICKEIVEYHQGRIWVESALGEGSTFSFTLPVSSS